MTKIAWTDKTWNPVTGCTKVSEGCRNCYAEEIAKKRAGTKGFPNGFDLTIRQERINNPIGWKTPKIIFVNSMSDLFHTDIPLDYLSEIWYIMAAAANWHVYQILTKRPDEMAYRIAHLRLNMTPNIWLGTSVEDQRSADKRIPHLMSIPRANKFLSCEPLIGEIDLSRWIPGNSDRPDGIKWVIDGGESGQRRRWAQPKWFKRIRDLCIQSEIPYFHKQGNSVRPGADVLLDGVEWKQQPEWKGCRMPPGWKAPVDPDLQLSLL